MGLGWDSYVPDPNRYQVDPFARVTLNDTRKPVKKKHYCSENKQLSPIGQIRV